MIELHCHTYHSDGAFGPMELIRRYIVAGYQAVIVTDHADSYNLDLMLPRMVRVCEDIRAHWNFIALAGAELTHIPCPFIGDLVAKARELGAAIVTVHGETTSEPVEPGTNHQALLAKVDFLAHPGFISEEDARLAAELGIPLEITTRASHGSTNGHVLALARKYNAQLVINNDAHAAGDIRSREAILKVATAAGMTKAEIAKAFANSAMLVRRGMDRLGHHNHRLPVQLNNAWAE